MVCAVFRLLSKFPDSKEYYLAPPPDVHITQLHIINQVKYEKVLQVELIVGDINDRSLLDNLFSAYAYVGESVTDPVITECRFSLISACKLQALLRKVNTYRS